MSAVRIASSTIRLLAAVVHQQRIIGGTVFCPQRRMSMRAGTHCRHTGAVRPMPKVLPFGVVAICVSLVPGILFGATFSKTVADLLEEYDMFVFDDDDDD